MNGFTQLRTKNLFAIALLTGWCLAAVAPASAASLKAGVARVSINPMEEKIPTQLGGYGAREGKPAEGTLDTIYGKVILFDSGGEKSAVVTVDMCTVPICVAEETLKKAAIGNLTLDRFLIAASHTHTGLEGFSLDRRNIANNPHTGRWALPPGSSPKISEPRALASSLSVLSG